MEPALKVLRILQIAFLFSIVLYMLVGELVGGKQLTPGNTAVLIAMSVMASITVVVVVVLRRVVVAPAAAALITNADDTNALMRWKTANVVLLALSESIALYGLVLRILGHTFGQAMPLYLAAIILLLYCGPKRPVG